MSRTWNLDSEFLYADLFFSIQVVVHREVPDSLCGLDCAVLDLCICFWSACVGPAEGPAEGAPFRESACVARATISYTSAHCTSRILISFILAIFAFEMELGLPAHDARIVVFDAMNNSPSKIDSVWFGLVSGRRFAGNLSTIRVNLYLALTSL